MWDPPGQKKPVSLRRVRKRNDKGRIYNRSEDLESASEACHTQVVCVCVCPPASSRPVLPSVERLTSILWTRRPARHPSVTPGELMALTGTRQRPCHLRTAPRPLSCHRLGTAAEGGTAVCLACWLHTERYSDARSCGRLCESATSPTQHFISAPATSHLPITPKKADLSLENRKSDSSSLKCYSPTTPQAPHVYFFLYNVEKSEGYYCLIVCLKYKR